MYYMLIKESTQKGHMIKKGVDHISNLKGVIYFIFVCGTRISPRFNTVGGVMKWSSASL